MNRAVLAAALPILLGGCTTLYPPLYSAPSVAAHASAADTLAVECRDDEDPLEQTVACAEILQSVYSTGYQSSARWQDISQLPIIGAAAAAAWILLKDESNAARKVGKIGIGALTYSAVRDQMLPKELPEIFINGHSALGCVIAERIYFRGPDAEEAKNSLDWSLIKTAGLAIDASTLRYTEPTDPTAAPELLTAARTLADQAITAANTQLGASRQERAAYQFAPSAFRRSVSDIAAWVASKGRARPNKSYEDLFKGMSSSPAPAPAPPPPPPPPGTTEAPLADPTPEPVTTYTSAALIRKIGQVSQQLSQATIELKGNTPPYAARIDVVGDCATDLSSPSS